MSPDSSQRSLSRISTLWSLVEKAHQDSSGAASAQRELLERYCGSVYRYLLGALRDEEAAADLFQDFALRFLRGDFRRADPDKGRFRDYLKTALIHLVTDYHRQRLRQPRPLAAEPAAPVLAEPDFADSWREELIQRTWDGLNQVQPTYHRVLLFQVQNPELSSAEAAAQIGVKTGKTLTAANVRVMLHRAREKFADLLLTEVERSLGTPSAEELRAELEELRLVKLTATAWKRRQVRG